MVWLIHGLKAMSYLSEPYLTETFFRFSHFHINWDIDFEKLSYMNK